MPKDDLPDDSPGALLLCRADADSVASAARLLREPMLLTGAGEAWSVLVPEGRPWRDGGEPVERVATGWATALAVGAPWPVLALWWDADRAGYTLASGFRRPVGYVWLTAGTPAGEDEAMRTFAARLGLDPVLDMQSLDELTRPGSGADARARMRGLLAVLVRVGVALPAPAPPPAPPPAGPPRPPVAARTPGTRTGRPAGGAGGGTGGRGGRPAGRVAAVRRSEGPRPGRRPVAAGLRSPRGACAAAAPAGWRRVSCCWPTAPPAWRTA
ncbi:hypothetical protein SGLAM104S_01425 [Streptomyces glaucescens]